MTNGMNKLRSEIAEARRAANDETIGYEVFDGALRLLRNGRPFTGRVTLDEARRIVRRIG